MRSAILFCLGMITTHWCVASDPIRLWPSTPPGDEQISLPPEADTSGPDGRPVAGRPVIRLGNVSTPMIEVYAPEPSKASGTSVIICPGGGHSILAYDLEGTEVAEWLQSVGVTAFLLKYRVPARPGRPRHEAAVQDGQRAVSLIRSRASEWSIDPNRIGILGFSAGGQTAALTALKEGRTYEKVDAADDESHKPNFAVLIYPAYLVDRENPTQLLSEVTVTKSSPPMFLVHAWDDGVTPQSSIQLAAALKQQDVRAELHVFDRGGHGYGMRPTELPVTHWPKLCESWLAANGWLSDRAIETSVNQVSQSDESKNRDEAEIRKVLDDQLAAWNRGDIDTYMQGYWNSDELTFSSGGEVTRGYQTTRDRYRARYSTAEQMGKTTFSNIEITLLGTETAKVLGDWKLERAESPIGGNFTLIMQRFSEGWRIIHDHTSTKTASE